MTTILISGFAGAVFGALFGFGVDRWKGSLDRKRQSRAIATALRFELKWASAVCQRLIDGWGPPDHALPNPVDMLSKSSEYVSLFDPNDVALLLKANGMWQYLMESIVEIRQRYVTYLGTSSPGPRRKLEVEVEQHLEGAREDALAVIEAMKRADERLIEAKGAPQLPLLSSGAGST